MSTNKLSEDICSFLDKSSTKTFLSAARTFVELLEDENINLQLFYSKAHTSLLELYTAGHKLEIIELKYSNEETDFDREILFNNKNVGLISELGEEGFYWQIFDPTYSEQDEKPNLGWKITDKEASQGWLGDDFADIYRDLKVELEKIDKISTDEAVEDALWQLKFGFAHHWGDHCINALRYLHFFYYDGKESL